MFTIVHIKHEKGLSLTLKKKVTMITLRISVEGSPSLALSLGMETQRLLYSCTVFYSVKINIQIGYHV